MKIKEKKEREKYIKNNQFYSVFSTSFFTAKVQKTVLFANGKFLAKNSKKIGKTMPFLCKIS